MLRPTLRSARSAPLVGAALPLILAAGAAAAGAQATATTAAADVCAPAAGVAPVPGTAGRATGAPVAYQVAFPNAAHHEAEVQATFTGVPAGRPLEVRMSRSSPGRYAIHEFAKNVYSVSATDGRGRALRVTRPNPYQWNVAGHDGTVRMRYTIFGDRADGTYLGVDRTHAHMNMPATFMWARGLESRPVRLSICAPDPAWTVATQLAPTSDPRTFTAPHLQYFMDSPTEVSEHELHTWQVTSGGRTQTLRLALHHVGTRAEGDAYAQMVQKVVREQEGIFGELAAYDFGTYTFLADYLPWDSGDGMEHRNSTVIISSGSLAQNAAGLLGTASHEFFHSWNVERIRPASLEPFDFTEANMSGELWLAEGFTQYYGPLAIRRAGLSDDAAFVRTVAGTANAVITSPGRRYFSPVEMSQQAPFVDAASSIDPVNRGNTFISYYTWGAGIALALDLELRARGHTLDEFMRGMWTTYGKPQRDYAPVQGYTVADARRVLGRTAGDTAWANAFFARYVTGREAPDYAALLARAGILLRPARPDAAWLGDVRWTVEDGRVTLGSSPLVRTPLYDAGIESGDVLRSIDGRAVATADDVAAALAAHRPGDQVAIVYESRGSSQRGALTLAASPRLEGVLFENADRPLTDEIRRFRTDWLASRAQ